MSLCNVLKSYASPEAKRKCFSTHTHSSSLQMLLSAVKHSWCWHVTPMFYTLMPICYCMTVHVSVCSVLLFIQKQKGSLFNSYWHHDSGGRLASWSSVDIFSHTLTYSTLFLVSHIRFFSSLCVFPILLFSVSKKCAHFLTCCCRWFFVKLERVQPFFPFIFFLL